MRRFIILFNLVFAGFLLLSAGALGAPKGWVISLQGTARVKSPEQEAFQPLNNGDYVSVGAWIRLSAEGKILILGEDGQMLRVQKNREFVYQPVSPERSYTFGNVLKAFVRSGTELYQPTVRAFSVIAPDWLKELRKNPPSPDQVLNLSEQFYQKRHWNKLNAAISLLKHYFSSFSYIRDLSFYDGEQTARQAEWQFYQVAEDGRRRRLKAGENQLPIGGALQIRLVTQQLGFFYLLSAPFSTAGQMGGTVLYPVLSGEKESGEGSYILPDSVDEKLDQILPGPRQAYLHQKGSSGELFWGLACFAPVKRADLKRLQKQVEREPNIAKAARRIQKLQLPHCPVVLSRPFKIVSATSPGLLAER